jgi:hypothetical protein
MVPLAWWSSALVGARARDVRDCSDGSTDPPSRRAEGNTHRRRDVFHGRRKPTHGGRPFLGVGHVPNRLKFLREKK